MRLWLSRTVLGGALIALGIWGWKALYPGPEHTIRKHLSELAHAATIDPNESSLVKLAKSQKLASFFTPDTEIQVDMPGRFPQSVNGREEVMQAALSVRSAVKAIKVQFIDISVKLESDGETGVAHFTVKADVAGESTPQVEELEARFKKVDGDWLIKHVENVKTLR